MNWSHVRYLLMNTPAVHFQLDEHRISIASEGQCRYQRAYVIFIDYRLQKSRASHASEIMRKVLRPRRNADGFITHYHFRDHGVDNIIVRLQALPDLQLVEHEVSA